MTDLRQAAQQALEALERADKDDFWREQRDAITTLKAALEQPIPTHRITSWGHCGVCRHDRISGEGCARQECPDSPQQQAEPVAVHQWREQGCADWYDGHPDYCDSGGPYETRTLYTAQALAAQPEQEPVGSLSVWYHLGSKSMTNVDFDYNGDLPEGDYELYTTPPAPKREWQGLTESERNDLEDYFKMTIGKVAFDAIEAKLKERNT